MANGLTPAPMAEPTNELEYARAVFHEMGLRPIWLRGVVPGANGHPNAATMLLIPEWVEGASLVQALRGIARTLGQEATNLEEQIRRAQAPESGNGGAGPQAMIHGVR